MSIRQPDTNLVETIRNLQEDIKRLKAAQGRTKVNALRLGNWVLEAEADELIKMTNLTTGVVSYVGANDVTPTVTGDVLFYEIPPFVVSGVIRNVFDTTIRTHKYKLPVDFKTSVIEVTLEVLGTGGGGIVFDIYKNDAVVYQSPLISAESLQIPIELSFLKGDYVDMRISDDGDEDSIGLTVILRA